MSEHYHFSRRGRCQDCISREDYIRSLRWLEKFFYDAYVRILARMVAAHKALTGK